MDFKTIALTRQSCREYDPSRDVEEEKLQAVLEMVRLAPSACNALTACLNCPGVVRSKLEMRITPTVLSSVFVK